MLKRILCLLICSLAIGQFLNAQITTSNITGFVKGDNGEPLVGATVVVTHVPTGTVYTTLTKTGGKYDLGNLNPGGPYTFTISYVNFQTAKREDIFLTLGETSKQDFELSTKADELTTVTVVASRASQSKGGVETN